MLRWCLSFCEVLQSPQKNSIYLIQSDHWVPGHLSDQGPSSRITHFGWTAWSRSWALSVPLEMYCICMQYIHILLNILFINKCTYKCIYIQCLVSSDLCLDTIQSRRSTGNSLDLMAWYSHRHTPSTETLYRQVCALPNYVHWIQLSTAHTQLCCRSISEKQDAPELNSKCHYYGSEYFHSFLVNTLCTNLFLLCHCGVLCVDW